MNQVERLLRHPLLPPKKRIVVTTDKPLPGAREAMDENRHVAIDGQDGLWRIVSIVASTADGLWRTTAIQHDPADYEWHGAFSDDPNPLAQ